MDFAQARFNMVEQQIRPWDVLEFDLLDVLMDIPREYFVPESMQNFAYSDKPLPLENGHMMLEPKIVARMIQGLALKPTDKVLEVGTGSGYATAIMARLARQVLSADTDGAQQQKAARALAQLGIDNVTFAVADGLAGVDADAPYDAIYIGGAVDKTPQALLNQLAPGGRLVAVSGDAPVMTARCYTLDGQLREKALFDTLIPRLDEATRHTDAFVF